MKSNLRKKKLPYVQTDDSRLEEVIIEVPENLLPEWENVTYVCDDPSYDMIAYPDDWLYFWLDDDD